MAMNSHREWLRVIEQTARRWAAERYPRWSTELEGAWAPETPTSLILELHSQGWLPTPAEVLGLGSPATVVTLGRALGERAAAAFVLVLTHVMAAKLWRQAGAGPTHDPGECLPIATGPYWDYSQVPALLSAQLTERGWLLTGRAPLVIGASLARYAVLPVQVSDTNRAVCVVDLRQPGVSLGEVVALLGLRGAAAHDVALSSVLIAKENLVSESDGAWAALNETYTLAKLGVLGLLAGLVNQAYVGAAEYAQLRMQGGCRIADHGAVNTLLQAIRSARDNLSYLLDLAQAEPSIATGQLGQARAMALGATDAALQVFGGMGYMCPADPERCWRDTRQAAALCSVTAA
jgi:alkylation response protein AidB-like acyl-CoA dehydrogenase